MPSLLITEESILMSAELIVRMGGSTFIPMLIAFDRFMSRISIVLLAASDFYKGGNTATAVK